MRSVARSYVEHMAQHDQPCLATVLQQLRRNADNARRLVFVRLCQRVAHFHTCERVI